MSQLLATDIFYATDSAGWVWKEFKKSLALAETADYEGDTMVSYFRKNMKAIEKISRIINGGTNGLDDRTKNYNILKNKIFQIKSACINVDKIK